MIRVSATVALSSGVRLSYAAAGATSGPTIVLLPGPTDSWRSYSPVLDLLTPAIRAVAVSQRGHGESDKPASGYRVKDFAADVLCLLDRLEIERSVLAGHSGSCLVARRVAIDHPERIAGMVLEASPVTLQGDPGLQGFVTDIVSNLRDPIDEDFARSFLADTSSEALPPDLLEELTNEILRVPAHVWKELFTDLLAYDDTTELRGISAPTLLIWGDADSLVTREMQDTLVDLIPDAALRVYEGVGHTPRWENPRRFSRDLIAAVERSLGA